MASERDHVHPPAVDWRVHGVKVIPGDQLDPNTPQTPGMSRAAGGESGACGAEKIWAGTVTIEPMPRPARITMAIWKASSMS
jgi:uncharacterized RmlC-like cupin family protein